MLQNKDERCIICKGITTLELKSLLTGKVLPVFLNHPSVWLSALWCPGTFVEKCTKFPCYLFFYLALQPESDSGEAKTCPPWPESVFKPHLTLFACLPAGKGLCPYENRLVWPLSAAAQEKMVEMAWTPETRHWAGCDPLHSDHQVLVCVFWAAKWPDLKKGWEPTPSPHTHMPTVLQFAKKQR